MAAQDTSPSTAVEDTPELLHSVRQACSKLWDKPLFHSPRVTTATAPRTTHVSLPSHLLLGSRIVFLLRNCETELYRPYFNCFTTQCFG
jgi:hypothetical protein